MAKGSSRKKKHVAVVSDSDSDSSSSEEDEGLKGINWEWSSGKGTWKAFHKKDSGILERYFSKTKGKGTLKTKKVSFAKDAVYSFNFGKMTQSNSKTSTKRKIRRLSSSHDRSYAKLVRSDSDQWLLDAKKASRKGKSKGRKKRKRDDDSSSSESVSASDSSSDSDLDSDSDSDDKPKKKKRKGARKLSAAQLKLVKQQAAYGAQSQRGQLKKFTFGPTINGDPHAKKVFNQLLSNEVRLCGDWAVFYHSYSFAALLYEVQAAVAAVLFRFKSQFASLPRLICAPFKKIAGTSDELRKHFSKVGSDHDTDYRSVGICASTNLTAQDPEATPTSCFLAGYSCADLSFDSVLSQLLLSCHVPKSKVKKLAKDIVDISGKAGLNVSMFGGKPSYKLQKRAGHLLQIFVRRDLVDKYMYSGLPGGTPCTKRHPIGKWVNKNHLIQGQVRIVANPEVFLRARCVRMFVYSADPKFHGNREKYQRSLTGLLAPILGHKSTRTKAARGIMGGKLPKWFKATDQRKDVKVENEYK